MPRFSSHARLRRAQRRIAPTHIELALDWGRPVRQRDGRVAWHLGRREVARARAAGVRIPARAVVVARDGTVVTVVLSDDRHRLRVHGRRLRTRRPRGGVR